jgi:hypothetical protein
MISGGGNILSLIAAELDKEGAASASADVDHLAVSATQDRRMARQTSAKSQRSQR